MLGPQRPPNALLGDAAAPAERAAVPPPLRGSAAPAEHHAASADGAHAGAPTDRAYAAEAPVSAGCGASGLGPGLARPTGFAIPIPPHGERTSEENVALTPGLSNGELMRLWAELDHTPKDSSAYAHMVTAHLSAGQPGRQPSPPPPPPQPPPQPHAQLVFAQMGHHAYAPPCTHACTAADGGCSEPVDPHEMSHYAEHGGMHLHMLGGVCGGGLAQQHACCAYQSAHGLPLMADELYSPTHGGFAVYAQPAASGALEHLSGGLPLCALQNLTVGGADSMHHVPIGSPLGHYSAPQLAQPQHLLQQTACGHVIAPGHPFYAGVQPYAQGGMCMHADGGGGGGFGAEQSDEATTALLERAEAEAAYAQAHAHAHAQAQAFELGQLGHALQQPSGGGGACGGYAECGGGGAWGVAGGAGGAGGAGCRAARLSSPLVPSVPMHSLGFPIGGGHAHAHHAYSYGGCGGGGPISPLRRVAHARASGAAPIAPIGACGGYMYDSAQAHGGVHAGSRLARSSWPMPAYHSQFGLVDDELAYASCAHGGGCCCCHAGAGGASAPCAAYGYTDGYTDAHAWDAACAHVHAHAHAAFDNTAIALGLSGIPSAGLSGIPSAGLSGIPSAALCAPVAGGGCVRASPVCARAHSQSNSASASRANSARPVRCRGKVDKGACERCGARMRGFGAGYCTNRECRLQAHCSKRTGRDSLDSNATSTGGHDGTVTATS
ncbi:hypothetical protein KFE25_005329 [Diacronema lutheri]|uniref:Uncharacterized protein n=1 Tax=Diacronema lutheri TaxID=2081491 RepID=A0A8J6CAQ5_DIALT|nr:hypothetical protein KFE25_005329 [Diacronema lutheri]